MPTPALNSLFASWLSPTAVVFWIFLALCFWFLASHREEIDHFWTKIGVSIPLFALLPNLHMIGFLAPIVAPVVAILIAIIWVWDVGSLLSSPLNSLFNPGASVEEAPLYSHAETQIQRGRYEGARSEIFKQMRRFPKDYRLHRMLAELHLKRLNDSGEAKAVMEDYMEKVSGEPGKRAIALHQLADWSLDYEKDLASARLYLERIIAENASHELVERAGQRLGQLPSDETDGAEADSTVLAVVERDAYSLGSTPDPTPQPTEPPAEPLESETLLDHLDAYPDDAVTREKLVRVWAFDESQPDAAIEEIESFLESGFLTAPIVAKWTHLKADIQIKVYRDLTAARETLHRLIQGYPDSAWSATAQSRIAMLNAELKGIDAQAKTIRLSSYDDDLGLKT